MTTSIVVCAVIVTLSLAVCATGHQLPGRPESSLQKEQGIVPLSLLQLQEEMTALKTSHSALQTSHSAEMTALKTSHSALQNSHSALQNSHAMLKAHTEANMILFSDKCGKDRKPVDFKRYGCKECSDFVIKGCTEEGCKKKEGTTWTKEEGCKEEDTSGYSGYDTGGR